LPVNTKVKWEKFHVFHALLVSTNQRQHKQSVRIVQVVSLEMRSVEIQIVLYAQQVLFNQQVEWHRAYHVVLGCTKIKLSKHLAKHAQTVSTMMIVLAQQHVKVVDLENIQINRAKHQQIHAKVALLVRMVMQMVWPPYLCVKIVQLVNIQAILRACLLAQIVQVESTKNWQNRY
jgi:hypothetical protein